SPRVLPCGSMMAAQFRPAGRPVVEESRRAEAGWTNTRIRLARTAPPFIVRSSTNRSKFKLDPGSPHSRNKNKGPGPIEGLSSASIFSIFAWLAVLSSQTMSNWTAANRIAEVYRGSNAPTLGCADPAVPRVHPAGVADRLDVVRDDRHVQ